MSHNEEAERTVLGAILAENGAMASAYTLEPGDFYAGKNRLVFSALRHLIDRGDAAELVSLKDTLGSKLEQAGGAAYLASLMDGVPRLSNVGHWVKIVRAHATRRRVSLLAAKMCEAVEKEEEPEALIERSIGALIQLARRANPDGFLDNRDLSKRALKEIEDQAAAPDGILGLHIGLIDVDRKLQGIRPGQLGLIGARFGAGKSILALQTAEFVAYQADGRVAIFSREMSGVQLTKRRLSAEAKVSLNTLHLATKEQSDLRFGRLAKAREWVSLPDVAINTSASTVPAMRALARQLQAEHGLDLVVVDYVQLLEATGHHERRYLEIKEISAQLKGLAMDLEVPVLAVIQLNRAPEARSDRRPSLSDAADGDSLGRDCDWALLIHRDPPPKKGQEMPKDVAHLILDKNRDGMTGTIPVRFNPRLVRFENLAREGEEEAAATMPGES